MFARSLSSQGQGRLALVRPRMVRETPCAAALLASARIMR